MSPPNLKRLIDVAAGREPADLLLANGKVVNVLSQEVYAADVALAEGRIAGIGRYDARQRVDLGGRFICPGFIDAHVHIESSMLSVEQFSRLAAAHGTAAVVTDPHELANVLGVEGIRYVLRSSEGGPIDVYVMLSSCVPASHLESAGAKLSAADLAPLLSEPRVLGLAEVMNYPGVVAGDADMMAKLRMAAGRVIDGHAPGVTGRDLVAYCAAGIHSDHECTSREEAAEKLRLGLSIMIREGSTARNLDALLPLVTPNTADRFMFVTDDKDVEDLLSEGHIDCMVRRAVAAGLPPALAVRVASYNAARHFGLRDLGAICPGYRASLCVIDDFESCRVGLVYHDGILVAVDGACVTPAGASTAQAAARPGELILDMASPRQGQAFAAPRATMHMAPLDAAQLRIPCDRAGAGGRRKARVIGLIEDQICTTAETAELPVGGGHVLPDAAQDIAKIAVIERHRATGRVGLGFVRGFGLRRGALASTVGHDAHNVVVAGMDDEDMVAAARHLAAIGGGLCVADGGRVIADVSLPIAGLMSDAPAADVAAAIGRLHAAAAGLGARPRRPFMALSFLSLSVIGALKVTDQGLIDVDAFRVVTVLV